MRNKLFSCGLAAIALVSAINAEAVGLEGSSVTTSGYCCVAPTETYRFTTFSTATVGAGTEFPFGSLAPIGGLGIIPVSIDINATQIDYNFLATSLAASGAFNGYVFAFTGAPEILGVSVNAASDFSPAGLLFTSNTVSVNFSSLPITNGTRLLLDITTAPVPEPSTTFMLLAGFLGLTAFCRHKRRAA